MNELFSLSHPAQHDIYEYLKQTTVYTERHAASKAQKTHYKSRPGETRQLTCLMQTGCHCRCEICFGILYSGCETLVHAACVQCGERHWLCLLLTQHATQLRAQRGGKICEVLDLLTCPAGRYPALRVCVFGLSVCVVVGKFQTGLQKLWSTYRET